MPELPDADAAAVILRGSFLVPSNSLAQHLILSQEPTDAARRDTHVRLAWPRVMTNVHKVTFLELS